MSTAKRVTLAVVAGGLLLAGAGVAAADESSDEASYTDTQSPAQVASSLTAILGELQFQGADALNGDNRPDGANGVENEFPPADPRQVEGPVGGLANGPFD